MKDLQRVRTVFFLGITEHVECAAVADMLLGANLVNRLVHFAVAPIAPFHRVRGRGK